MTNIQNILPESNGVTHISNPLGQTPTPKPRTPEIDSRTLPLRPTGLTTTPKLTQPAASVKHLGVATTSTSSPGMSAANVKPLAHNSTPQYMKKDYTVLLIQLDENLASDISTRCSGRPNTVSNKFRLYKTVVLIATMIKLTVIQVS